MVVFAVEWRIVEGSTAVGLVALKERSGGALGTYIIWLYGSFQLERVNFK